MENLSFVIWTIFYPVGAAICSWLYQKEITLRGEKRQMSGAFITAIINVIVWVLVAKDLYREF